MKTPVSISERRLAIDELDQAIVNLSTRINASTYELLVLIREFDERAGWLKWGLDNCVRWLHWRCDLSLSAAREKVRVAHALKALPEISAAFAKGLLSYSKVRALTRVATVANESSLLDFAMTATAARVEERCRQLRNGQPGSVHETNRVYSKRSLSVWRNVARGTMTITVELPIEQGELISQALNKATEDQPVTGPAFESESWSTQQADALVDIAKHYLDGAADTSRSTTGNYQVMIHVDHSALTGGKGRSDLPIESVKRLGCDGSVIGIIETNDGEPLRLGRKQRMVSTSVKRALWARDRGCSYPGCGHTRFVDAHHVKHWSDGGETNLDNLVLLCGRHHRLVHEGGYEIRTDSEGRWYFRRPDGRAIPAHGYSPDDMIDDDIGTIEYPQDASAEGFACRTTPHQVRESAAKYRLDHRGIPAPATGRRIVPYGDDRRPLSSVHLRN